MNGDSSRVNGQPTVNGASSIKPPPPPENKSLKNATSVQARPQQDAAHGPQLNGIAHTQPNGDIVPKRNYQEAPEEVLNLVGVEHYLPVSTLVGRTAQNCWNEMYEMVSQLANISVPAQSADPGRSALSQQSNNQTKSNLDKKDRILNFASDYKATFIKLLVLLQWSRNVRDISKAISLRSWFFQQRLEYQEACLALFRQKARATAWQIPNPDIQTAGEILGTGRASLSNLGYRKTRKLTKRQIVSTFRRLNQILTARLALDEGIPTFMNHYRVHDGRVTFRVADEFEVDLSVLEEETSTVFRTVDVRFLFTPRPSMSAFLRSELERLVDAELASSGLSGCYEFLHNLTLSNQLAELHRQALDLARNQWVGNLRVQLLRRNLIIQYWTQRQIPKSWIEIGVYNSTSASGSNLHDCATRIGVRWFREGKLVEKPGLNLQPSVVSLTTIINQIAAQHISHNLSIIYDRLAMNALFTSATLSVEETTSLMEPEECCLQIDASHDTTVTVKVSAVTGLFSVAPASERTNRLQYELNRSKAVLDDFVPKFLNFRCAIAETQVLSGIANTPWETLPGFKPSLAEVRGLLGPSVARANFFSHPSWPTGYLLAIAYKSLGDTISILHFASSAAVLATARTVFTQPLQLNGEESFTSFEDLSTYACGVVVLDKIAQGMSQRHSSLGAPLVPDFEGGQKLPALAFHCNLPDSAPSPSPGTMARLKFLSMDDVTHEAMILVQLRCDASTAILEQLMEANPDPSIEFAPKHRQVALRLSRPVDKLDFSEIVQQVQRLCDVVASVQFLQTVSQVKILTLSLNTLCLAYQLDGSKEWKMEIDLPTQQSPPRVHFLPEESNPLACLSTTMSQTLENPRPSFVARLKDMYAAMKLVEPLMRKVWDLQHNTTKVEGGETDNRVHLHIVVRQPTMIALQYYADAKGFSEDNTDNPPGLRLLARFEILPLSGQKITFILRPALEELKAYKRPSFASDAIRKKVKEGVFVVTSPGWLCLDMAAVFLAAQPDTLLDTLHQIMVDVAKQPEQPSQIEAEGLSMDAKPPQKPGMENTAKPPPQTPVQPQRGAANGINSQQRPKQMNKTSKVPQGREIITLDD